VCDQRHRDPHHRTACERVDDELGGRRGPGRLPVLTYSELVPGDRAAGPPWRADAQEGTPADRVGQRHPQGPAQPRRPSRAQLRGRHHPRRPAHRGPAHRHAPGPSAERRSLLDWRPVVAFARCSRAVYRMDYSPRGCLPQLRPLRRHLPFRANSLLGLIHTAVGLIGGDQLARLGAALHAFTVPSGAQ